MCPDYAFHIIYHLDIGCPASLASGEEGYPQREYPVFPSFLSYSFHSIIAIFSVFRTILLFIIEVLDGMSTDIAST
jgi:hypothetical protein